ncbi:helix-turn-helix transcriptional regulator [Candidatus Gracilibacteria bacterium]|nr:helix-turn-helix transcriptional regulator [Candidatus Gracilibacteria bacterium]
MKNNITLYRGISSENLSVGAKYLNLTTDFNFAKDYGNIVLVYSMRDINILEEDISERKDDVRKYDKEIQQKNITGYKWKISDIGIYHYRVKASELTLEKIIYTSVKAKDTISALTRFNRKYLQLNQTEFSRKIRIPRVKISEYENAMREPSLEKIALLGSLIDIPQEMNVGTRKVILSK